MFTSIAYLLMPLWEAVTAKGAERKPEKRYECVRWAWTGDVYNRRVFCLEWREKK